MNYTVKTKNIKIRRNRSFDLSLDNVPPPISMTPPSYSNSFFRKFMGLVSTKMINEKTFNNYKITNSPKSQNLKLESDDLVFDMAL